MSLINKFKIEHGLMHLVLKEIRENPRCLHPRYPRSNSLLNSFNIKNLNIPDLLYI